MISKKKIQETYKNYKFILNKTKLSNSKFIVVIFLTLLTAALDAVGIGILIPIAEYILGAENGNIPDTNSWKILTKIFEFIGIRVDIVVVTFITILIIIIRQVLNFFKGYIIEEIRFKVILSLRKLLFTNFLNQDYYFVKNYSTGKYNYIINTEVEKVAVATIFPIEQLTGFIFIISYLFLMSIISMKATILVFLLIFISGLVLKKVSVFIHANAKNIIKLSNEFSQNLVDRLLAIKLIKINSTIIKEKIKNYKILESQFEKNISLVKINIITNTSLEPLLIIIAVPIIVLAVNIGFPLAKLGVFVILLARFLPVFKTLVYGFQRFFQINVSTENLIELINNTEKQKELRRGNILAPKIIKEIKFKKVAFKYNKKEKNIFKNFSCIFKGEKINALVGRSGTGKSTIINMIPRLLTPSSGDIFLNQHNLETLDVNSLRSKCSFIDQKPIFTRGTIIEHITANAKISYQKCIKEAKLANAHEFIIGLPNKYNYKLGEAGVGLSGGQLQRLDITRALASNRPIMILDEPTSSLDSKNSNEIFKTLRKINKVRKITIIIVTHDKSILKYCDNYIKI